jgi:hypothetical protein
MAKELIENKFTDIRDFLQQNSLIQDYSESRKSRLSLISNQKIFKNYGHINTLIIEPYSSGEESDMEDDKIIEPSVRDVAINMIDHNTIMTVKNIKDFPKEARLCLLLTNVDEWMTPSYIKIFIEETPIFM